MANYNLGRYVGPDTVTGQYIYFNEATGDFILSDTSPSPDQLNAWQAENPKVGKTLGTSPETLNNPPETPTSHMLRGFAGKL